jgi:hypothetical protein
MKLADLFESNVVKVDFSRGKGVDNPDIEIPKGFDRFEVDGRKIIGIKGDTKKVVSTTGDERLAKELVRVYNGGKASVKMEPVSMIQAFGSEEMNVLHQMKPKVVLAEKPDYWDSFEGNGYAVKNNISHSTIKDIESALGAKLKVVSGEKLFGKRTYKDRNKETGKMETVTTDKPVGPSVKTIVSPSSFGTLFIVEFDDETRYLVDTSQANTYIRLWQKINKPSLKSVK